MAEDKKEGMSAGTEALLFVAGLAALAALWWWSGGPGRADLRGIFLQPPAPVGSGDAYGPGLGTTPEPYDASGAQYQATSSYPY